MTDAEVIATRELIWAMASYFGQTLTDDAIKLQAEDLADLSFEDVRQAYRRARRDPKTRSVPLPSAIRAVLRPEQTPEWEAIESSSRILQAITRFGPYRADDAHAFIGELGWRVVARSGGWAQICAIDDDQLPTMKAQWRQLALATHARAGAGLDDEAPGLPIPESVKSLLPDLSFPKD